MNGSRAKKLRRVALDYVLTIMKVSAGEGKDVYNHAMNRIDWMPQLDSDGFPMKDPDGVPLMKPDKFPGTLTNAWKWRVLYRSLKAQWKGGPKGWKSGPKGG
jgi:hypothetical protein